MPNGGSDNCGTCWFNTKNKGEAGSAHLQDLGPNRCAIRGFAVRSPLYTYCVNHPKHAHTRLEVPIGPVLEYQLGKMPPVQVTGDRAVLLESPDTPEIRDTLLSLLANAVEYQASEYPAVPSLAEAVIWQLGEFREPRAVPYLTSLLTVVPKYEENGLMTAHVKRLPWWAEQALAKIRGHDTDARPRGDGSQPLI
jgi:hypothetical protein